MVDQQALVGHMEDQQALVGHMEDQPELVLGRPGLEQGQLVSESDQPDMV